MKEEEETAINFKFNTVLIQGSQQTTTCHKNDLS
jgi:hypothetical protein